MKYRYCMAMLLLSLLCVGCASISERTYPAFSDSTYPATQLDAYMIMSGGGIWQTGDCDNAPFIAKVIGWTIVTPLHIVDLPISLVTDTVMLPHDLNKARNASNKPQERTSQ